MDTALMAFLILAFACFLVSNAPTVFFSTPLIRSFKKSDTGDLDCAAAMEPRDKIRIANFIKSSGAMEG